MKLRKAAFFKCTWLALVALSFVIYLEIMFKYLISSYVGPGGATVSEDVRRKSTCETILTTNQQGPVYISAKAFLNTPPDTGDFLSVAPVQFLTDVKNPCFALTNSSLNVGNIDISTALENGYEIRCLPYFYLAGFSKCGTSDIYRRLAAHSLISGGYKKMVHPSGKITEKKSVKEVHFWDNTFHKSHVTMDNYTKIYGTKIVKSFSQYGTQVLNGTTVTGDYRNLLYFDATPRTIWHGDSWDRDPQNVNLTAPRILLPHKLHHALPHAKIMVSLRDPADRLLSDFKYYYNGKQTPGVFHRTVVDAISWWDNCTKSSRIPKRACAYGKAPGGLEELGTTNGWNHNDADRLRISIYDIFIKDWLDIFPQRNFLFIKFEAYADNPVGYIERHILPFLGLPPYSEKERKHLSGTPPVNPSHNQFVMFPHTKKLLDTFFMKTTEFIASLPYD